MKKSMILLGMLAVGYVNAQEGNVGINTETPTATLEVKPSSANALPTATTNEGIIAPRLSKTRIANISVPVEGTLVYATDADYTGVNVVVSKITEKGYYYFDGTEWVAAKGDSSGSSANLYTNDGKLLGVRTVDQDGNNLSFVGEGNVGIGTATPTERLHVGGDVKVDGLKGDELDVVFADEDGKLQRGPDYDLRIRRQEKLVCGPDTEGWQWATNGGVITCKKLEEPKNGWDYMFMYTGTATLRVKGWYLESVSRRDPDLKVITLRNRPMYPYYHTFDGNRVKNTNPNGYAEIDFNPQSGTYRCSDYKPDGQKNSYFPMEANGSEVCGASYIGINGAYDGIAWGFPISYGFETGFNQGQGMEIEIHYAYTPLNWYIRIKDSY